MKPQKKKNKQIFITKYYKYIVEILFIFSIFMTLYSYSKSRPIDIVNKILDNNIVQRLDYSCKVNVIPNILYPSGGLVNLDSYFPSKITKSINVSLKGVVSSDKSLNIQGTEKVDVTLFADNLWQHTFSSETEKVITSEGNKNNIMNYEYNFDPREYYSYIAKVEQETDMRAGKYTLKIKPLIKGNITYKGKNTPLNMSSELNFEVNNGRITLVGMKKFVNNTPIETAIKVKQNQKLFGKLVPISYVMSIFLLFSVLTFLILLLLATNNRFKLKNFNYNNKDIVFDIDKKYKNRLIFLTGKINSTKPNLKVSKFKTLLRLADEKEISILRVEDTDNSITYCVIDENCMYSYEK